MEYEGKHIEYEKSNKYYYYDYYYIGQIEIKRERYFYKFGTHYKVYI